MMWLGGLGVAALSLPASFLIVLAPEVMANGLAGLSLPLALLGGLLLTLCLAAHPWGARAPTLTTAVGLRFDAPGLRRLVGVTSLLVCLLILWGEMASVLLLGSWWRWPSRWPLVALGILGIAMVAWAGNRSLRWIRAGAFSITAVALCLPLVLIMVRTDPRPLPVWGEVAGQRTFAFKEETVWRPLPDPWLPERLLTLEFRRSHRVTVREPGRLRLVLTGGGRSQVVDRWVERDTTLTFLQGDRLILLDPVSLTFEGGKEIPGSPSSGAFWADGAGRSLRGELGLVVTLLVGALGMPPLLFTLGSVPSPRVARRALLLGAFLLALSLLALQLWGIYGARFAPQLYLGGVRWGEMVFLPELVGMGHAGRGLVTLAQVGFLSAFVGAFTGTLEAGAHAALALGGTRWPRLSVWAIGCVALALAAATPLHPFRLAVSAFGLAAVTLAPALLLTAWWGRVTPLGLGVGIVTGLVCFVAVLAMAHLPSGADPSWLNILIRAPAVWLAPLVGLLILLVSLYRPRGLTDHFSLLHRRLSRGGV